MQAGNATICSTFSAKQSGSRSHGGFEGRPRLPRLAGTSASQTRAIACMGVEGTATRAVFVSRYMCQTAVFHQEPTVLPCCRHLQTMESSNFRACTLMILRCSHNEREGVKIYSSPCAPWQPCQWLAHTMHLLKLARRSKTVAQDRQTARARTRGGRHKCSSTDGQCRREFDHRYVGPPDVQTCQAR